MALVDVGELRAWCLAAFARTGLGPDEAAMAGEVVEYADTSGFTTHGLNALVNIYVPRLLSGRTAVGTPAEPEVRGALASVDGKGRLGLLVATEAIDLSARLAKQHGIGLVTVRNSTHFGSAGYYAHRAATADLVAVVASNCGRQGVVPPLGGRERLLGTNPLALACPAEGMPPFVLDMSCTSVATGKIRAAQQAGVKVPVGWLQGADGRAVTDPEEYFAGRADVTWLGVSRPTGAAKGYGLALMVELLCGAVAGAGFGPTAASLESPQDDDDIGHVFLTLDPEAIGSQPGLRAADLLNVVTMATPRDPKARATYPGRPEHDARAQARARGVDIPFWVLDAAGRLAKDLGIHLLQVRKG